MHHLSMLGNSCEGPRPLTGRLSSPVGHRRRRETLLNAKRLALAVLVLAVVLALAVSVQAQGTGVLQGQVVNGTADGPEVGAGVPVVLHVFRGDTEVDSLETTTDGAGIFRFEELDTDASLEYRPAVLYLGVPYSSAAPLQFDGEGTALDAAITVYEITDDESTIGLESVHFIAESFGEVLRISEIHLFGNSGDRAYVGQAGDDGRLTTVHIPLPENAVGLAFEQGGTDERFVQTGDGLMDTEPVPPGTETSLIFFSYHLMVGGETIPLERRFAYPVSDVNVLVAQPGLTLQSEQLEARGAEFFQGRQYEFYGAQNLPSDTPLAMQFVLSPEAAGDQSGGSASAEGLLDSAGAPTRGNQQLLRWLGFALLGVAVVGVVVYSLSSRESASASVPAPELAANPRAQRLLSDLADLEEAFEAGQVDEATYARQRAELRDELKSL
jgi:hypothetical protein